MSSVWKYFIKKTKDTSICKLCFRNIKSCGNTSNALKHLKSCHSNLLEPKPTRVIDRVSEPTTSSHPRAMLNPILRAYETRTSLKTGGARHSNIINAILYYICVDHKPFHTVKCRGFLKLIKTLEPNYQVPSDTHVKNLISEKYAAMKNALKERLKLQECFSAACDIWTETMNMTSFLGVTLHYLEGIALKSSYIATIELHERHTGENVAKMLSEIFENWGLDKKNLIAVLTDNGANMVSAIKQLFENSNTKKHIPCFAHTINLIAEKVLSEGAIPIFVKKVRDIVKYFKRSVLAANSLKKSQYFENSTCEPKKLILDVNTRWNSCFYMSERFVELAAIISPILLKDYNAPPMLSAVELNSLRELISLLKPLEYITRELCGEQYVTISKVIPLTNCLINQVAQLQPKSAVCVKAKEILQDQIQRRFGAVEQTPVLAISTLLDPRFKNLHFKNPEACAKAVSYMRNTIAEQSQNPSSGSGSDTDSMSGEFDFWQTHKELAHKGRKKTGRQDELALYVKNPVTPLKSNPIESWEDMKVFPGLYRQFRRYAAVVATSVPAERLFSKAGAIITQNRNRLKPKRLNELLFLAGRPEEEWF